MLAEIPLKKISRKQPNTFEEKILRYFGLICILVVIASVLIVRVFWGFTFPVPWNDETAFLAQAESLSRTGSLFVSALNDERVVMWMPPSYMATLAIAYKIFGYSYEISRWISSFFYLGSFATLFYIAKGSIAGPLRLASLAFITVAFISPYGLATANVGRMESMYTCFLLLSLAAMLKERHVLALSIIIASATIHFNAIYFLLPSIFLIAWCIATREKLIVHPEELLSLTIALALFGLYAIYAAMNLSGFIEDMRFQFDFKLGSPVMSGPKGWTIVSLFIIIGLVHAIANRKIDDSVIFTLYGASFLMLALNGHNMWYSHSFVLGYLLPILGIFFRFQHLNLKQKNYAWLIPLIFLITPYFYYGFNKNSQFEPMWPRAELFHKNFLPESEIKKIEAFLLNLPEGTTVSFGYTGVEPFFLNTFATMKANWSISGKSVTSHLPLRNIDFRIKCDSSLFPQYLSIYDWDGFKRKSEDTGCEIIKIQRKTED